MLVYSITEMMEETSRMTAIEERLRMSFPRSDRPRPWILFVIFRIAIIKFLQ